MKSILWLMILVASLLTLPFQADATPVLLGTFSLDSAGFGIFGHTEAMTGVSLGFSYDSGAPILSRCVGCGIVWTDGQVGQVDFTAANTPSFSIVASRLTNGVNELVGIWAIPIFPTTVSGGGGEFQFEDVGLGGKPDFVGHHVDLIRLIMRDVDITVTPTGNALFNNEANLRFNWEFYEEVPEKAPEPASTTLLLCGLTMAGSVRYFRRCSSR
jgi:hypothetical protein